MGKRGLTWIHTHIFMAIVIALAVLGIVLTVGLHGFDDNPLDELEQPIITSEPEITAERGGSVEFEIALQNGPEAQRVIPQITCVPFTNVGVTQQALAPNEIATFEITADIVNNVATGEVRCNARADGVGGVDFTVIVT